MGLGKGNGPHSVELTQITMKHTYGHWECQHAMSTIQIDAGVDGAILLGEYYDDSVSGQGKSSVLSLQKLLYAL